jgi:hypothetical protein
LAASIESGDPDYFYGALVDMAKHFEEDDSYLESFYSELNTCFDKFDDKILRKS